MVEGAYAIIESGETEQVRDPSVRPLPRQDEKRRPIAGECMVAPARALTALATAPARMDELLDSASPGFLCGDGRGSEAGQGSESRDLPYAVPAASLDHPLLDQSGLVRRTQLVSSAPDRPQRSGLKRCDYRAFSVHDGRSDPEGSFGRRGYNNLDDGIGDVISVRFTVDTAGAAFIGDPALCRASGNRTAVSNSAQA
jgi:hypothetical protein